MRRTSIRELGLILLGLGIIFYFTISVGLGALCILLGAAFILFSVVDRR